MSRRVVLALDPIREEGLALLRARPDVELVHLPDPDAADLPAAMARAEALILRGRTLDHALYEAAPRLTLVSRHGVGCDNLDLPRLERLGIGVAIAADANATSVAEHAMALTLAALKRLPAAQAAVRAGDWAARERLGARDLAGAAVLVVGLGRIGRLYAGYATAFGAVVTGFDPMAGATPDLRRADDLRAALADADVVSLHLPRTPATQGLIDAPMLAAMRPGAVLVNTARGGIVDEGALAGALDAGRPAIYATDVLAAEPPAADDALIRRADVIVTPHSAAMTDEGALRMATGAARNVLDHFDGRLAAAMTVLPPRRAPAQPETTP